MAVHGDSSSVGPRRVVLGVGGGIAAYKAASLLRRFTESGHDVTVVPTEAAHRNLTREGVPESAIELTGNTIIDTLHYVRDHKIPEDYEHAMLDADSPELASALRQVRARELSRSPCASRALELDHRDV